MCDYAIETVADVEARKKTARFGPQIKNALLLAVVAFFVRSEEHTSELQSH